MSGDNSTAITKPREGSIRKTKATALKDYLESPMVRAKLSSVAANFMKPEDMVRLCLIAGSRQTKILECTPESIVRCLMDAAQLKIRPGGVMGRGYIVPRWNSKIGANEAVFDPGYRGLIDIARRGGAIKSITAHVIHELDEFRVTFGTDEKIEHVPFLEGDPGPIKAAYAVATFNDGSQQVELLTRNDLNKIMAVSTSKDRRTGNMVGPWTDWEDEMARKSAVRRLCKYLPYTEDLDRGATLASKSEVADLAEYTGDLSVIDADGVVQDESAPRQMTAKDKLRAQASAIPANEHEPEHVPAEALTPEDPPEPGSYG